MRPRNVLAVFATAVLASSSAAAAATPNASFILTLPLQWVDRLAYVASVSLDGVATNLQVSTMLPYTWVTCGLLPSSTTGSCQPERCDYTIYYANSHNCAVQQKVALQVGSSTSEAILRTPDLALRVAQYQNLSEENDTSTKLSGLPTSSPNYAREQPRLVTGAVGALGLGRGSIAGFSTLGNLVRSFSLVATNTPTGSLLMLDIGPRDAPRATLGSDAWITNNWTANYTLPVRTSLRPDQGDALAASWRWDLSLVGVRFGDDTPLYPRAYTWADAVGSDAAATLSLNHAVIQMPTKILTLFKTTFLSACSYGRNAVGNEFFLCPSSLKATLPQITLYVGEYSFTLEADDYTHVPRSNASVIVVELEASDDSTRWVLGAPFLRKFPARFDLVSHDVTLYCDANVACQSQSLGDKDRAFVEDPLKRIAASSGPSSRGRDRDRTQDQSASAQYVIPAYTQSPVLLAAIWTGRCLALLILLAILLRMVTSCRDRCLGRRRGSFPNGLDDTGTVASERDLEEAKEELRAMTVAEDEEEEDTERQRRSYTAEEDDAPHEYALIQSPRQPHRR